MTTHAKVEERHRVAATEIIKHVRNPEQLAPMLVELEAAAVERCCKAAKAFLEPSMGWRFVSPQDIEEAIRQALAEGGGGVDG